MQSNSFRFQELLAEKSAQTLKRRATRVLADRVAPAAYGWFMSDPAAHMVSQGKARDYNPWTGKFLEGEGAGTGDDYRGASLTNVMGAALGAATGNPLSQRRIRANRSKFRTRSANAKLDADALRSRRTHYRQTVPRGEVPSDFNKKILHIPGTTRIRDAASDAKNTVKHGLGAGTANARADISSAARAAVPLVPGAFRGGMYRAFGGEDGEALPADQEHVMFTPAMRKKMDPITQRVWNLGEVLLEPEKRREVMKEILKETKNSGILRDAADALVTTKPVAVVLDQAKKGPGYVRDAAVDYAKSREGQETARYGMRHMIDTGLSSFGPGVAAYSLTRLLQGRTAKPKNRSYEELDRYHDSVEKKKRMAWLMAALGSTAGAAGYGLYRMKYPDTMNTLPPDPQADNATTESSTPDA